MLIYINFLCFFDIHIYENNNQLVLIIFQMYYLLIIAFFTYLLKIEIHKIEAEILKTKQQLKMQMLREDKFPTKQLLANLMEQMQRLKEYKLVILHHN